MDRKFKLIQKWFVFLHTACCFAMMTVNLMLVSQTTGSLVVAPGNRVVAVGQSVQLDCSTDDTLSVSWEHFPLGAKKPVDVYISRAVVSPYSPRFAIQIKELGNSVTSYNLVMTNIRMEDAGTYSCIGRTGMGERRNAELTVLGSLPNCTSNIGPNGFICENDCRHPIIPIDEIHASCSIEYAGNIALEMQWATSSGQGIIQHQPIPVVSEKTVSSDLNIAATKSMNGASIIWYSTQTTQTNWTSAPIKILYAKENLSQVILSQSENVTCSANSSQHCSYAWFVKTDPEYELKTVEGRTLEVNKPGTYICHAYCPLHHSPCTVIAMNVEYKKADEYNKNSPSVIGVVIGVVIGSLVTALVIMTICILVCLRMKQNVGSGSSLSKNGFPPSTVHLINKFPCSCLRQNSNGTPSSSNTGSTQSGSDEIKPCMNENLNEICDNFSDPSARENERQVDVIAC